MIIYISPRRSTTLVLRTLQRDERMPDWKCRTMSWLFRTRNLPAATYIFLSIDRLEHNERRLCGQFYRHINSLGPGWRALNDPSVAMGRYRLLRSLHEAGINDFNAYLVAEGKRPSMFPVFIRRNNSNKLPLTGLLNSQAELDREVDRLIAEGEVPEYLIIIEYLAEEVHPGIYRKQAEYRVADQFVPNPSIYAGSWFVKYSKKFEIPAELAEFDKEVMATNPFETVSRQAFEIAGIEYGRADFGIVNGRPQFYEINFNPDFRTQRQRPNVNESLYPLWVRNDDQFLAALCAISETGHGSKKSLSSDELNSFRLRFWRNYAPQRV